MDTFADRVIRRLSEDHGFSGSYGVSDIIAAAASVYSESSAEGVYPHEWPEFLAAAKSQAARAVACVSDQALRSHARALVLAFIIRAYWNPPQQELRLRGGEGA